jgi:phosphomethylpyrimidine synthase
VIQIHEKWVQEVAEKEHISPQRLRSAINKGRAVILGKSGIRGDIFVGIGKALTTKVNVNLGTSSEQCNVEDELEKARIALKYGADTISDCSMQGNLDEIRQMLLKNIPAPLTTIPIYQVVSEIRSFPDIQDGHILRTIERQVKDGVSSIVIHAGFSVEDLDYFRTKPRLMGVVSKGGSMTSAIALSQGRENPFLTLFEQILDILNGSDVVLNLGNAMRSGCVHDSPDLPQSREVRLNAKLARRANERGVQVIIEGLGGHVNARQLPHWVRKHKRTTGGRPLFVAGPLPTEIGVGHDHISAAIGGALAAGAGADYLCAITPAEHLGLPTTDHIREGVIAAKLAAHVADSMKHGLGPQFQPDFLLSSCRYQKDWAGQFTHALDPEGAARIHPPSQKVCTMCGNHCALDVMKKLLR